MFFGGHPNPSGRVDVQRFTSSQVWRKPSNATMVYIYCVGGGGGGGGGFSGLAGTARGGGGGGAASPMTTCLVPAMFVPDSLNVVVGVGGAGVTTGAGGTGTRSIVGIGDPNTTVLNVLICSGAATGSGGGGTGTAAAVGAGGTAAAIPTIAQQNLISTGIHTRLAGNAGNAGGAVAGGAGTSFSIPNSNGLRHLPGCGGAGTTSADFAGGGMLAVASCRLSEMAGQVPAAGSFNGGGSVYLNSIHYAFCALGGSSSNTGIGGAGGNGLYGSGGGGGGAGTTGGRGGDGGGGLVLIISW